MLKHHSIFKTQIKNFPSLFFLTKITTFCSRSLRLIAKVNFEPLVDHGFINHWLLLLLRQPFGLVYAGYFVRLVNCGLQLLTTNHITRSELWFGYCWLFPTNSRLYYSLNE